MSRDSRIPRRARVPDRSNLVFNLEKDITMSTDRYRLGVDLGTTFTEVGIAHGGSYRMLRLGQERFEVPSTIWVSADGQVQVGEEAERMAESQPSAVARDCKRRFGDTVPLLLEGHPFSPQALMARLLRWALDTAEARMDRSPELITVTCPANWGPYKHELLRQMIRMAETPTAIVCTEPEAAAIRHAGADAQRPGALVGVYDLGGGTFDAAVLRPTGNGIFTLAGAPEGVEHLGGIDFDEALYSYVLRSLGQDALDLAESEDPDTLRAMAALRRRCVRAKEELSGERLADVEFSLPGSKSTSVSVGREEFEAMIRPALAETVRAFERAVRNAGTTPDKLTSVVLVGGSVRIPLVFETVSRALDCQVVVPREPGHSVALGAAMAADRYQLPSHPQVPRHRPSRSPEVRLPQTTGTRLTALQRDATVGVKELLRLMPTERAKIIDWRVKDGSPVSLGQALATVEVRERGRVRSVTLRSPFHAVIQRRFLDPGSPVAADDVLAAFREVTAYLHRPGRVLAGDQGLTVTIKPPTSATATAGRPVLFVDRIPCGVWWSARFTLLTEPGPHLVSAAYMRHNQWFGFATQTVEVPARQLVQLEYIDPGSGATAVLRPSGRRAPVSMPPAPNPPRGQQILNTRGVSSRA